MVDSLPGQNVMWDGQKFKNTLRDDGQLTPCTKCDAGWSEKCNNTLQDDSQLTGWTKCGARWSEIQQHLVKRRSTHSLDVRWLEIQEHLARRRSTHCLDGILHRIIHYLMPLVILQHLLARNHPFISFFPTWLPFISHFISLHLSSISWSHPPVCRYSHTMTSMSQLGRKIHWQFHSHPNA